MSNRTSTRVLYMTMVTTITMVGRIGATLSTTDSLILKQKEKAMSKSKTPIFSQSTSLQFNILECMLRIIEIYLIPMVLESLVISLIVLIKCQLLLLPQATLALQVLKDLRDQWFCL